MFRFEPSQFAKRYAPPNDVRLRTGVRFQFRAT